MDDRLFRNAMGSFATGVTVIASKNKDGVHCMTANAFMSQSLNPKLIIISLKENAHMLEKVQDSDMFSVNILAEEQQDLSMIFAGQIKTDETITFEYLDDKPVIPHAIAQIACNVKTSYVEGDHTLFIGQVSAVHLNEGDPLIFSKGKYCKLAKEK